MGAIIDSMLAEAEKEEKEAKAAATPAGPPRLGTPPYREPPAKPTGPIGQSDWWTRSGDFYKRLMDEFKDNPYMHVYDDLMRGDVARNVNSRSGTDTLRMSRLADALNNTYFRMPGQLRSGVVALGGQYIGTQGDYGQLYQMPIETEEMRQQDRARGYEAAARNAALSRQAAFMGAPVEQMRNTFASQLRESGQMSDTQIAEMLRMFDYQMSYGSARQASDFTMLAHNYTEILSRYDISEAQANAIAVRMLRDPVWATLFGQGAGMTAPNIEQMVFLKSIAAQVGNISNPDEQRKRYYQMLASTNIDAFKEIFNVSADEARRLLDSFRARGQQ